MSEDKAYQFSTADSVDSSLEKARKAINSEKLTEKDFVFGKLLGEGSFSCVYLAKKINMDMEFAVKVCEKRLIKKENKVKQVLRERDVMNILNKNYSSNVPFFVKLAWAFQDESKLYFVMTYCKNGDLLDLLNKEGNFDIASSKFYSAEILRALEHLHSLGIVHRDIKPENILLDSAMHIRISDFGSSKILPQIYADNGPPEERTRRSSLDGTAQYVSPEVLNHEPLTPAADIWAFGCVIYQMISGLPPFRGATEYLIFEKILKVEYDFPSGFYEEAKDLVRKILVLNSCDRIGSNDATPYASIRNHRFFIGTDFENLANMTPPKVVPFVPELDEEDIWKNSQESGLVSREAELLLGLKLGSDEEDVSTNVMYKESDIILTENNRRKAKGKKSMANVSEEEMEKRLSEQIMYSKWHKFADGNLILKQGLVIKKKGLFPRTRMFLLTTGPHLYYIDPEAMVLKGEIPWGPTITPDAKNFKAFLVHTPNRIYNLMDPAGGALEWCNAIEDVREHYVPSRTD